MPTWLTLFTVLVLGLITPLSHASSIVEALQMPAWITKAGGQRPLQLGMQLEREDEILTGKEARVYLRLQDGSLVKLGADTRLRLDLLEMGQTNQHVLGGWLDVVQGAFRFTTDATKQSYKRDLRIRFGSVVAGVRGTDLWGSSDEKLDLVCLIEGSISVAHRDKAVAVLDEPLTHVRAEKGQAASPVLRLDPEQLAIWAAKTEIQPGQGVLDTTGGYAVNLLSVDTLVEARTAAERFDSAGYAVEIFETVIEGRNWFRLRIKGLASMADAESLAASLRGRMGAEAPWVSAR